MEGGILALAIIVFIFAGTAWWRARRERARQDRREREMRRSRKRRRRWLF